MGMGQELGKGCGDFQPSLSFVAFGFALLDDARVVLSGDFSRREAEFAWRRAITFSVPSQMKLGKKIQSPQH